MRKIESNKQQKRESLMDSAFSLFIENGFHKTSISDITDHAGVAKGTFYLYFHDKTDLRDHLIAYKASQIFQAAYAAMQEAQVNDFEDQVIFITDHILGQFASNHNLMLLIAKHLSWGFFRDSLFLSGKDIPAVHTIYESLLENANHSYRDPQTMMYLIVELVSGASYNVILYNQPITMEVLKPSLYQTIRSIFDQFRV